MRTLATVTSLFALALAVSCGGDKPAQTGEVASGTPAAASAGEKGADTKVGEAAVDSAGPAGAESGDTPAAESAGEVEAKPGESAGESAGEPAGAESGGVVAESAGEAVESAGEAPAESAGEAPAESAGEVAKPDEPTAEEKEAAAKAEAKAAIAALLKSARSKRTSDAKADKALAEAEEQGAELRDLAKAANDRGEALMGERDRAIKYFEWARDKDAKYPDASFNLAKIEVLAGNVPGTIAHLEEVKKRGGRKLLKTVGYDPLFEVVKDDRTVQKLIR